MEHFVNFDLPRCLVAGLLLGGITIAHAAGPSIITAPTMVNTNLAEITNPPRPQLFKLFRSYGIRVLVSLGGSWVFG